MLYKINFDVGQVSIWSLLKLIWEFNIWETCGLRDISHVEKIKCNIASHGVILSVFNKGLWVGN